MLNSLFGCKFKVTCSCLACVIAGEGKFVRDLLLTIAWKKGERLLITLPEIMEKKKWR
jgi:hypothetical protein